MKKPTTRRSPFCAHVLAAVLMLTARAVIAQDTEETMSIAAYVSAYLQQSNVVDTARETAEEARAALDDAQVSEESPYAIGLLANSASYAEAQVRVAINSEVVAAVTTVDGFLSARQTVEAARSDEAIAASVREMQELLFEQGELSRQEILSARSTHIQAQISLLSARNQLRSATEELVRSIGADAGLVVDFGLADLVGLPPVPDTVDLVNADPLVAKLEADLAFHRGRRESLAGSPLVSEQELATLDETISGAETELRERRWEITDEQAALASQVESSTLGLLSADIAAESARLALLAARQQFERGDINATDVSQAELSLRNAESQVASAQRSRYLLSLEIRSLGGEELSSVIGRF